MQADQLIKAMLEGENADAAPALDLGHVRALGRRRRRNRRIAVWAAAVLIAVAVALVTIPGLVNRVDNHPSPVHPNGLTSLNSYERRVLAEAPGAYAVHGEVVVRTPPDPAANVFIASKVQRFAGRVAPLGWHGMWDLNDGPLSTTAELPDFMRKDSPPPLPDHTQVWEDTGPLWIACLPRPDGPCVTETLFGNRSTGWYNGDRVGDDNFLRPGTPIEVRPSRTLENHRNQSTLIGGMHGTTTTRVVLTLQDGSTTEATIDRGRIAKGATLFWALTGSQTVRVTAYDATGNLVEDHPLSSCDDPVDCQTR